MNSRSSAAIQFALLAAAPATSHAHNVPIAAFYPWIAIFVYVACGMVWVTKSTYRGALLRTVLCAASLPIFSLIAFFLPLFVSSAFPTDDKSFNIVFLTISIGLSVAVVASLVHVLTRARAKAPDEKVQ